MDEGFPTLVEQRRPWQTDAELEAEQRSMRYRYGQQPQKPAQPWATYGLLITFVVVFALEFLVLATAGLDAFRRVFTIYAFESWYSWIERPWSPIMATVSHSPAGFGHIFFNGIALYFFGPTIENVLGWRKYLVFFFATGALSSIVQASIEPVAALGASGAILALIGISIILIPKSKLFIFPFPIPIPLWIGGIAFALIDLLGVFNPASSVGHFAHLSGMAVGLLYGLYVKKDLERRGLRLVSG